MPWPPSSRCAERRRALLAAAIVALAAGLLLACSGGDPVTNTEPRTTPVRIGYLPIAAGLPLFVAMEEEFFTDAGFDVELFRFGSSNDLGIAASTGEVDALMPFALNAGFDIGVASGITHQLFGYNLYSDQPPHIVDYLVARADSGITSLADLEGARVGGFPGSVTKLFIDHILMREGLSPDDYTYTQLGPQDWLPALESASVDVLSVMEPQASIIMSRNVAYPLVNGFFAKLVPDVPLFGHWLAHRFEAEASTEVAARFVGVFRRAVDFIRTTPDAAKRHYLSYIAVEEADLAAIQLNDWRTLSELDAAAVQSFADLMADADAIQGSVEASDYILSLPAGAP